MTTKVQKWGNSLAVRLPKAVTRRLALRAGSGVVVRQDEDTIVIRRGETTDQPRGKNDWKRYVIPTHRKKENVSGAIDALLYDVPR